MPPPEDALRNTVLEAAHWLTSLPPGPLAELRRMNPDHPAPVFWLMAARYPHTIGSREEPWLHITRILALLTPKGNPAQGEKPPLHNPERRLGAVLCDGGDTKWPDLALRQSRPALSELRLARLLASRGAQRAVLLRRAAQSLARSMQPGSGINVTDIAYALLRPQNTSSIARAYYARLDAATRAVERTESSQGNPQ